MHVPCENCGVRPAVQGGDGLCDLCEMDDFIEHFADDDGGIERTYLCCGRTIEDGHADSCYDRIEGDFFDYKRGL